MDKPTNTPEDFQHAHDLKVFAIRLRGEFLNETAWFEILLTDVIANYFCPDESRRKFFFSEVANKMRFAAKTALLANILRFEFLELHKANPQLRKRLNSLGEFRNMLAHSHIDTSAEAIAARKENEVSFIKYKAGRMTRVPVTFDDARMRAKDARELRKTLLEIQRKFRGPNIADQKPAESLAATLSQLTQGLPMWRR